MARGLVHLYTGDGKGKTTAAVGLAVRACGRGLSVLWTSFLKDYRSGEFTDPPFRVIRGTPVPDFWWNLDEDKKAAARKEASARLETVFSAAKSEKVDLLILDEAAVAASLGLIDEARLAALLDSRPETLEIVITGRNAPETLAARADYLTEMTCRRHPFEKGIPAREGIER